MTNSRLTDPEVLEFRFPVRLESYEIRQGSGGAGRWQGGNGGVRRVRFLEPMTASILSNGRKHGAFGMAGGEPGQVGINRVVRADGRVEALEHIGQAEMQPGDVFEIDTPGGGGYGCQKTGRRCARNANCSMPRSRHGCATCRRTFRCRTMRYANSKGVQREHPAWQAMTHFFNHQTHHRGQATTLLMQAGVDPGVTDLIALV